MKKGILILLILAVLIIAGWFAASALLQKRGYSGTGEFIGQVFGNYPKSLDSRPLKLSLDIEPEYYEKLQNVVDRSRERGVILPEGNDYVPARISSNGSQFKAKVRIKGKLTDHIEGDKWSFRILARKGGAFNNMQRFSIQHPGTRNYLYEWLYHRMMGREGVIALRYGFVDVELNQEPLGIYAYEEHFGQELLENNNRVPGPIFRFDPGLYWIRRLHEMDGLRFREAYADHHAALIDAYDSGNIFSSEKKTAEFREALVLMNALRSGQLKASDVFDEGKIGLRHAVIDLIGGHHSMDWSDVKFYYDPVAKQVEPVAYESFSVRPLKQLAGSFRYSGKERSRLELHDIYFNDELVFRNYISQLERLSSVDYLDGLFNDLSTEIDSVSAILFKEFPYKPLDKELYYKNAAVIRATLDLPKGFHAFISKDGMDHPTIQMVPVADLPVEIHGFDYKGALIALDTSLIIPARKQGHLGEIKSYRLNIADSVFSDHKNIRVVWSILGGSKKKKTDVLPLDYPSHVEISGFNSFSASGDLSGVSDFYLEEDGHVYLEGEQGMLNKDVTVHIGQSMVLRAGQQLKLSPGVTLRINGSMDWEGTTESPVKVQLGENSSIVVFGKNGKKAMNNIRLVQDQSGTSRMTPMVSVVRSNLKLTNVSLNGSLTSEPLVVANSEIKGSHVSISNGVDLLRAYYSRIELTASTISNASDDGLVIHGGIVSIGNSEFANINGDGLKLNIQATATLTETTFKQCQIGIRLRNGSDLTLKQSSMKNCEIGVTAGGQNMIHGSNSVTMSGVEFIDVKESVSQSKGSKVSIDGRNSKLIKEGDT